MLPYLLVFALSMVPVLELRAALPLALLYYDMNPALALVLSVLGNILPVPFLVVWGRQVLEWLASFKTLGGPFRWILRLGEKKVAKMHRTLFVSLLLFVAVPLPGTGAWTGALIALTLNLKLKKAIPPIALGVLIAGIIVAIACFAGGGLAEFFVSDRLINFFSK
ncbi:MAG: small multi-drug export protein [Clostridia bacterium]|nr:small multi-drug export protein [Clostridia bacterium]